MQISLQNLKIYLPSAIINNGILLMKDNIIESVGTYQKQKSADRIIDLYGYSAIPGYIDTHCHGAMGSDANDGILSGIENMNDYYSTHGITAYYPSLSVDPMPRLIKALKASGKLQLKIGQGKSRYWERILRVRLSILNIKVHKLLKAYVILLTKTLPL